MNFKITPQFTKADIEKDISKHMEVFHKLLISEIDRVGLQFVTEARMTADFDDQTGNLRSSIGYIIVYDGEIVKENFAKNGGPLGQKEGREYAEYQGSLYPTGYVLITVAGMEYASYVEAKGFDVITASTSNSSKEMRVAFQNIKRALKQ